MNQAEARKMWLEAVERVKDRTLAPVLWRALETGAGVTAEGDFFVVGFPPSDAPMSGYLTSSDHRVTIERVLTELLGKPTRLKVIEGTSVADYEAAKKRDAAAEQARAAVQERKRIERAAEREWETIAEQCARSYANLPFRQLPQMRGQYLFDAVEIISEAMDRIHPGGNMDEVSHRALARVVEKVATLVDVPAAVIALELVRYRREKARARG